MKTLKKTLYLVLIAIVTTAIGYFVLSYTQFNSNVEMEIYPYGFYRTKNENGFISFESLKKRSYV